MPAALAAGLVTEPEQVIEIGKTSGGKFTASYTEWNGQPCTCTGHDHLTRQDALSCAEDRLKYRA
jgi:hypothetical protein